MYSMSMSPTGREKVFDVHIMIRMPSELRKGLQASADKDRRKLADFCRLVLEDHAKRRHKSK